MKGTLFLSVLFVSACTGDKASHRASEKGGVYLLRGGEALSGERSVATAEAALLGSLDRVGVGYGLAGVGDSGR